MSNTTKFFSLLTVLVCLTTGVPSFAAREEARQREVGRYLVVNGKVTSISSRMLTIDGNQYPISKYVSVFRDGGQISFKVIHDAGKIDNADLYILGGKIEKIVVLKNL